MKQRSVQRTFWILVAIACAASIFGAAGITIRAEQANRNREANAKIWHAVICDIERSVISSPKNDDPRLTPARKRIILAFYDKLLVEDAHAAPCGLKLPGR